VYNGTQQRGASKRLRKQRAYPTNDERRTPPIPVEENNTTYVLDAENAAEMARLIKQDHLITQHIGGLLAERPDFVHIAHALDIACGPGGWVHEVATTFPAVEVVGIDISRIMIEYAQAQAAMRGLHNARFQVMDATRPRSSPTVLSIGDILKHEDRFSDIPVHVLQGGHSKPAEKRGCHRAA